MSATLTWYNSGLGTKTGTTVALYMTDLKTLIDSKSGDANFTWEVCGSELATTPYYLNLRKKDLSAGRISIIVWTSLPAGNNAAILDTAPTVNQPYIAWFPNGTGTTLSNLSASSGTINGNDTNCVKVSVLTTVSSIYGASIQHFYFDSAEGVVFGTQNPASAAIYMMGAGDLIVDSADTAYGCTFGIGTGSANSMFGNTPVWSYVVTAVNAGASTAASVRTNYGSTNRTYYQPQTGNGQWATQAAGGATDILVDATNTYAWFYPQPLVASNVKGGGFPIKLRQIAGGPGSTSAFAAYNETGPVVKARQFCANTGGSVAGAPWFVNFKI